MPNSIRCQTTYKGSEYRNKINMGPCKIAVLRERKLKWDLQICRVPLLSARSRRFGLIQHSFEVDGGKHIIANFSSDSDTFRM
jgi:hypothetical protein